LLASTNRWIRFERMWSFSFFRRVDCCCSCHSHRSCLQIPLKLFFCFEIN
jgi:hypothetical protein